MQSRQPCKAADKGCLSQVCRPISHSSAALSVFWICNLKAHQLVCTSLCHMTIQILPLGYRCSVQQAGTLRCDASSIFKLSAIFQLSLITQHCSAQIYSHHSDHCSPTSVVSITASITAMLLAILNSSHSMQQSAWLISFGANLSPHHG